MNTLTRRDFLRYSALAGASAAALAALSGCSTGEDGGTQNNSNDGSVTSTNDGKKEETKEIIADTARKSTIDSDERYPSWRIALNADPLDLLPHSPNSNGKGNITQRIYEALGYSQGNDYIGTMAKSIEEVDDLHWKITIYDDIFDTNGENITADDVVYSIHWVVEAGYVNRFDVYGGVEKSGDYDVTFTWTSPIDSLAEAGNPLSCMIFSQKSFEAGNFATDPVGTGPYKLSSFTSGSGAVLEARDDYWALDKERNYLQMSKIQTVEFKIIPEAAQNVIGLQTGDIDMSSNIPNDSVSDFQEGGALSEDYNLLMRNGTDVMWMTWNQSEGKIGTDINFRLACCWALNNSDIAAVAGNYSPLTCFCSPSGQEYNENLQHPDGYIMNTDIEKAKELLKQTAYDGEKLTVLCYSSEAYKNVATMIVTTLAQIGVNAEVNAVDNNTFDADMGDTEAWDIASAYFGGSYLPNGLNRILNYGDFVPDAGAGFIRDPIVIEKWKAASAIVTYDNEHIKDLLDYVYDNVYFYPTVSTFNVQVVNKAMAQPYYAVAASTCTPTASEYYLD